MSTTLPLVREATLLLTLFLTFAVAGCNSDAPLSESCNQAYSAFRSMKGEPNPPALADDLESIAEDGGAEAKDVFAPMVSALRQLEREGVQGPNPDYVKAFEQFAEDCDLPTS
jgi:hypothetical protein